MAHEIEIAPSGEARMFYAGETPWHGLGKGVEKAQTSAQAIRLAGLGKWEVGLEQFATATSIAKFGLSGNVDDLVFAEELRAITRQGTDGKVLGVATPAYQPIQNEQAFEFLDSLVADKVMHYESAGSLLGGRKIWILCKLETDVHIGTDEYREYLLLVMGHDSYTSLRIYHTKVRVICSNTLIQATRRTPEAVRIVHSGNLERKFEAAKEVLNVTTDAQRRMTEWMQKLLNKRITEDEVIEVRDKLFGSLDEATPARRRDAIDRWMSVYLAEREREGRSAYTVLQTITGYADHFTSLRSKPDGAEKLHSALTGTGMLFKHKGIVALSLITGVKAPAGILAGN